MASHSGKTRKLLSLDGGGVRGLSTIAILRQLMVRLAHERGVAKIHPWQEFDMICGTSTGGLLAIMLGRLRMTIDECEKKFLRFSEEIFTPVRSQANLPGRVSDFFQANGKFSTQALEDNIKRIVQERDLSDDALFHEDTSDCKVFVSVVSGQDGANTVLRSYTNPKRPEQMEEYCKIWEAARATSAASTLFDPIAIGPYGETFVDGALGFNNPIRLLDRESRLLWPNDKRIFLSIGTGCPPTRNMQGNIVDLAKRLAEIVVETERTADGFQQDNPALVSEHSYYRFNVLHGLEEVKLQEYQATAQIRAVTRSYLNLSDTVSKTEQFISSVAELESTVPELSGPTVAPPLNVYEASHNSPPPTSNGQDGHSFVGSTPNWRTGGNMPSNSPGPTPGVSPYYLPSSTMVESQYYYHSPTTVVSQYPPSGYTSGPSQYPPPNQISGPSQYPSPNQTSGPSQYPPPNQISGPLQYPPPGHTSGPLQYPPPGHTSGPSQYPPPGQTYESSSFSPPSSAPPTNGAPSQSRFAARREKEALTKELIKALDNTDITKMATVLKAGADPNARGIARSLENTEHWAIYIATYRKRDDMIKLLLHYGADVNPPTGTPPLIAAVKAKYEEGVELLIDSGANPNAVDPTQGTALNQAVTYGNLSMVRLLIDGGADVKVKTPPLGSALSAAIFHSNSDIFHVLVQCGAEIDSLGPQDQHYARQLLKSPPPASSWRPPASSASAPVSAPAPAPAPAPYTGGYPPASYETQYIGPWGSQTPTPPAAGMSYPSYQPWGPPPGNPSNQYNAPPPPPPRNPSNQYNAPPPDQRAQVAQPYFW